MARNRQTGPPRGVVTGAAGFIGSHLVTRLLNDGWQVTGIDDGRTGNWDRVPVPCNALRRDLTTMTADDLGSALADADVCFHLAAEKYNSSRATPQRVIDVNVSATYRLFEAAVRAGVPKVVFTSSLYAYGSMGPDPMRERDVPAPTTVYGMSKVAGEHLLRATAGRSTLGWSVARLFFVYGPAQYAAGGYKSVIVANFERLLRNERPVVHGDGKQALDYVYVDDAVDALIRLADREHDGLVCNVGSGHAISICDLTDVMTVVAGRDVEPVNGPADWTAGSVRVADPTLAREALGWTASTAIDDGVRRVWEWVERGNG